MQDIKFNNSDDKKWCQDVLSVRDLLLTLFQGIIIDLKLKVIELCGVYSPTGNNGQTTAFQSYKSLNNSSLKEIVMRRQRKKKSLRIQILASMYLKKERERQNKYKSNKVRNDLKRV